jgi:hypothetical protein
VCGRYNGRIVIDLAGLAATKAAKQAKKKEGNKSEARS